MRSVLLLIGALGNGIAASAALVMHSQPLMAWSLGNTLLLGLAALLSVPKEGRRQ